MAVISFPGKNKSTVIDVDLSTVCATNNAAQLDKTASMKPDDSELAGNTKAVRQFALIIAEKILNDADLNTSAPYVIDKIIMLLVKESRNIHEKP